MVLLCAAAESGMDGNILARTTSCSYKGHTSVGNLSYLMFCKTLGIFISNFNKNIRSNLCKHYLSEKTLPPRKNITFPKKHYLSEKTLSLLKNITNFKKHYIYGTALPLLKNITF